MFLSSENPNGLKDWGIIELQGDLEVRGNQIMSGQFIGDLCFDKYGKPVCKCDCLYSTALMFSQLLDLDYWPPYFTWKRRNT